MMFACLTVISPTSHLVVSSHVHSDTLTTQFNHESVRTNLYYLNVNAGNSVSALAGTTVSAVADVGRLQYAKVVRLYVRLRKVDSFKHVLVI